MKITIGRTNGPSTDVEVSSDNFGEHELDLVKDILAMVNKVSNNKERWYIAIDKVSRPYTIIPITK